MKYLRSYNTNSDDEGLLADILRDIRNLQDKSMLDEAGKLNKRLLNQSRSLEYFFYEKEWKWAKKSEKGENGLQNT